MIIGDKNTFAIEYEIIEAKSLVFGKVRLWIENQYFGCYEDASPLFPTCAHLLGIGENKKEMMRPLFENASDEEIFDTLQNQSKKVWRETGLDGVVPFGEPFDPFTYYAIYRRNKVAFLWQLSSWCPDESHPRGLQIGEASREEIYAAALVFEQRIREVTR